MSSLEARCRLD
uniref:Uncharacterized protein n=1 Tax=Arundo donax TaxID=35708 RepID=A0A0A9BAK4_ARUDO